MEQTIGLSPNSVISDVIMYAFTVLSCYSLETEVAI